MKTIRTYMNVAEAGFDKSLLEAVGIPALLADEQSFLMTPGLASGGIRLQVEDEFVERALQVLAHGPEGIGETPSTLDSPNSAAAPEVRRGGGIPVGVFVAGAVALTILAVAVRQWAVTRPNRAEDSQRIEEDLDHDGRPDRIFIYDAGHMVRSESDHNRDGRMDEWTFHDQEGRVERCEQDRNFDGRVDAWSFFNKGEIYRSQWDADYDGVPDWFVVCENGQVVRADCRPSDSSIVTRSQTYVHDVLTEERVDENRDGVFDYKMVIDPFGERSEKIPLKSGR